MTPLPAFVERHLSVGSSGTHQLVAQPLRPNEADRAFLWGHVVATNSDGSEAFPVTGKLGTSGVSVGRSGDAAAYFWTTRQEDVLQALESASFRCRMGGTSLLVLNSQRSRERPPRFLAESHTDPPHIRRQRQTVVGTGDSVLPRAQQRSPEKNQAQQQRKNRRHASNRRAWAGTENFEHDDGAARRKSDRDDACD